MKFFYFCAGLLALICASEATKSTRTPPKVQVYSRNPGEYEVANVLICTVSDFHPPDISIQLMRNGEELPSGRQTDLAFTSKWHFHLTRNAKFTPKLGDKFLCRVDHGGRTTDFEWDTNM